MTENDKALVRRLRERTSYTHMLLVNPPRPAPDDDCHQAADRIEALAAENERLRGELRKANLAEWFYFGEDCDSDSCRDCIDECIGEDFEWTNEPEGDHVLLISGGRPVPDMWVALHYYTEAEKDGRDSDDEYTYTVHATHEEAEIALADFRTADAIEAGDHHKEETQ